MRIFTAMSLAVLACGSLFAQSAAVSQISGTVQDATGLAVPEAQVRVTQTDTGLTRSAISSADGTYVLQSLPIGPYRMEVTKQGFSTYVQSGIVLQVNTNPSIDVTLKIGSVSEQVQVEAAAAMVETHSTGVGQVVDQQRVVDLPLNGRNATDLIYLAGASATAPAADLVSAKNYPGEAVLSIAGGLANGTLYMLDGGTHNDPFNNLNLPLPFPDALQEFKVETSALPAQYGQHSAGAVNAVTKSGGNSFHGDAFEFVRNYEFNARNFFAPTRDSLKRNQFGGTIGGPIKHDKIFFFLGYQGNIIRSNPSQSFSFIPTPAMLSGNFLTITSTSCAASAITLKDPNNGNQPFPGNQIPVTRFSAPALKMMSFYPTTTDPCGKSFYGTVANQDEHQGLARIDYQLTSQQNLFFRYFITHSLQPTPYDGKNPLSMTLSGADDLVNSFVLGHTWVLGAGTVNSFRATFDRSAVTKTQVPTFDGPTLGINMHTLVPGHLVATATGAIYSSSVFSYGAFDPTTGYQLADDVSKVIGNHQIGFGVNMIRPVQYVYGPLNGDGNFTFNGQTTGLSMADFLLGKASAFTQGGIQYDYERYRYIGLYIQDNWKVTQHLSISAGLRWEPFIGGKMPLGYVQHFDMASFLNNVHSSVYPNAPAGVFYPGDSQFDTNGRPSHIRPNDFAPRIGMVWDPKGDGRMTIRASYGLFYELPHTLFAYGFSQAPPWGSSISLTNVDFANPWANYPGGDPFPLQLANKNFQFPQPGNYTSYPLDPKITYLQQWNLSIQKQIGKNWLASASYLGNNTVHLWADAPINAAIYIPGGSCVINGVTYSPTCSTTANTNQRRTLALLNPSQGKYFGIVHQLDDGSTANYNALLVSIQHRLANHFTVLGNYTWSHCIAGIFTSELDGTQYTNPQNRNADRGNCAAIDRRHLLNISAVEEAPKFANKINQWILGDWKLSQILRVQSGGYFTVIAGVDQALNGNPAPGQRANYLGPSPYAVAGATKNVWLNRTLVNNVLTAWGTPAIGTFGNLGQSSLLGPGSFQFDMSLSRSFNVREHQRLELRGEAFNVLNHWRPGNPGAALNSVSTFGLITSSGDPRIMQFALKYLF
jgi:Carboxypeptidase regulatory-like domain/TonB dependent receptor